MLPSEVRQAIRSLVQRRSFTVTAILTLALGLGATLAIFTVVEGVLLRPLPFPESDRALVLCETNPRLTGACVASPANVADWARASQLLEAAGVARDEAFIGRDPDGSYGVRGGIASPGFFRVLLTQPALGRIFDDPDLLEGANGVVIISNRFWRDRLGADPGAVGRSVTLDGRPFVVVGVLAADAYIPELDLVEVWKPLTASVDDVSNRSWRGFFAIARMAPDVAQPAVEAELRATAAELERQYPAANAEWGVRTEPLRAYLTGSIERTLWLFLAAVSLVLVIACSNVAGLLLVQGTRRQAEFAVRTALGASRMRLVGQAMTEHLVLSLVAGAIGLGLAVWLTRAFLSLAPPTIPRLDEVHVSARIASLALLLATVTSVLFGSLPAWRVATTPASMRPQASARVTAGGLSGRSLIVTGELALALALLVGAGLLGRAFLAANVWNQGFDRSHVWVSWMLAPANTYKSTDAAVAMLWRARAEVASVPGVRAVALASAGPLFGGVETGSLVVPGRAAEAGEMPPVHWFDVDEHYFDTLGVRILEGRGLSAADRRGSPNVAVVNESLVRRYFPNGNAIGQRVTVMTHTSEIVGIVADIRPSRPDRPTPAEVYWPIQQYPRFAAYLVIRTMPEMSGLEATVRARVGSVDPAAQVTTPVALDVIAGRALVSPRFNAVLVGVFAAIAVGLAAIGIGGMMAFAVTSRTREIGVRLALGASPGRLVASIVRQGLTIAAGGVILGTVASLWLARSLGTLLYGVPSSDPLTLAATLGVFVLITTVACYVPARRASRVDPLVSLRAE